MNVSQRLLLTAHLSSFVPSFLAKGILVMSRLALFNAFSLSFRDLIISVHVLHHSTGVCARFFVVVGMHLDALSGTVFVEFVLKMSLSRLCMSWMLIY